MPGRVVRHQLRAATDAELAVHIVKVLLHSVLFDTELAGDPLVREALAHTVDNL